MQFKYQCPKTILLEHSCVHSFTYHLWLLSYYHVELSSCNRDQTALKIWNIYYLALHRKSLPAPVLKCLWITSFIEQLSGGADWQGMALLVPVPFARKLWCFPILTLGAVTWPALPNGRLRQYKQRLEMGLHTGACCPAPWPLSCAQTQASHGCVIWTRAERSVIPVEASLG